MHVELKTSGYRLSVIDKDRLDQVVERIDRLTNTYTTSNLHVTVERAGHGSNECQVRIVLGLSGRQYVATERAPACATAAQQCASVLVRKIELAKERVHRGHGERKVRRAKEEAALIDLDGARAAHAAGDFEGFVDALGEVPELVEAEVGRRLKFHPLVEEHLNDEIVIADLVDRVLHRAYNGFGVTPDGVSFREWLMKQVDLVLDDADKEFEGEAEEGEVEAA